MKLRYRTVWISDTHLGSRGARAAELSAFLKRVRCDKLYLVGDIIDMESLRQRWYWPAAHNDVIRRLLKMAKRGVEIIYIPGNHDAGARQYLFLSFGGLRLCLQDIHHLADGRRLLVTHGDQYDLIVTNSPWLAHLGTWTYDWLLLFNRLFNGIRAVLGLPYYSLSQRIKMRVKSACQFMSRFEQTLSGAAKHKGLAGVVCGHIHKAESKTVHGVSYFNCGDWVEGCSALVEHDDGRVEVIDAEAILTKIEAEKAALVLAGDHDTAGSNAPLRGDEALVPLGGVMSPGSGTDLLAEIDDDFDTEVIAEIDGDPNNDRGGTGDIHEAPRRRASAVFAAR
ncbi:MAG: UDP-2,3-diacylglucosamine diphosphatase [Planctomycetes bacterium]|nr:UDP-2,3-diacylglucosamine diphosphatase [Planctomycetota bacterium]